RRGATGAGRARPLRVARAAPDAHPGRIGRLAHAVTDLRRTRGIEVRAAAQALGAVAQHARRNGAGGRRLRGRPGRTGQVRGVGDAVAGIVVTRIEGANRLEVNAARAGLALHADLLRAARLVAKLHVG